MSERRGLDEAIGRMIWVGVRGSGPGDPVFEAEVDICERAHVGGVILFDVDVPERNRWRDVEGLPEAEARLRSPRNIFSQEQVRGLVAALRSRLGEDLIVSIDQEGGWVSRLNPARGFPPLPSAREYAALAEGPRLEAARTLAGMVASCDVDLNLTPCVDVAVNPDGPGHTALGRSFGRDPAVVTRCAAEQIEAMHAAGVAACLKHFPGHGSARGDSHFGLVDVTETFVEADELAPYVALASVVDAVMVSHLMHRGYDPVLPCSLSRRVVEGVVRGRLGFEGVVMTDALDMHAISDRFGPGEASALALEAGVDAVLEANNLTRVYPCPALAMHGAIRGLVASGRVSEERIRSSNERLDRLSRVARARRAAWKVAHG